MAIPESDEARCLYSGIVRAANSAISMSREDALDEPLHVRVVGTGPVEAIARGADTKIVVRLSRVVSKKSIVLSWAVLKWSVQSNRYGDLSISGCRSIPRSIVHQQSRLECSEFRCKPSMGHHISRSKVGVFRRPCGSSSSGARRDVPADALRLRGLHAQARDRSVHCPNLGGCARCGNAP
jgi:hypothetical protein